MKSKLEVYLMLLVVHSIFGIIMWENYLREPIMPLIKWWRSRHP